MKKGIIIGVAIAAVLAIILVVVLVVLPSQSKNDEADKQPKMEKYEYKLGEMYTNLADEGKVLKVSIAIEYQVTEEEAAAAAKAGGGGEGGGAAAGPLDAEFEKGKSKITNDVFELFREKTYSDLMKPSAQEKLSEQIKDIAADATGIEPDKITNVYFLEFIVQG